MSVDVGPLKPVVLYDANGNILVGQKTMAASVPVTIASDQAGVNNSAGPTTLNAGLAGGNVTLALAGRHGIAFSWGSSTLGGSNTVSFQASFDGGATWGQTDRISVLCIQGPNKPAVSMTDPSGFQSGQIVINGAATHVRILLGPNGSGTGSLSNVTIIATDLPQECSAVVGVSQFSGITLNYAMAVCGQSPSVSAPRVPSVHNLNTSVSPAEYNWGNNLRISAAGGSIEAKGQKTMANSIPVTFASDQTGLSVSGAGADAAATVGNPVLVAVRESNLITRTKRGDKVGTDRTTSDVVLWHDAFEGSTINSFWTQSTTTMTIAQAAGVLTLNNAATITANTDAIITSQRQYPRLPGRVLHTRFRANLSDLSLNHTPYEFGFGAPSGVVTTIANGAFFRFAGGSLSTVTSSNGTENGVATGASLNASNYYDWDIYLFDDYARFIVVDSQGTPVVDTVQRIPVGTITLLAVSHIPSFARIYVNALGGSGTPKLNISEHIVDILDCQMAARPDDQAAFMMRHCSVNPTSYAQTTQLAAAAAPGAFTPSNTAGGNAFLGGEAQVNSTATSENLLSIFAFTVPTPYTYMLRGLRIPRPIITTALTTTACILEFFLIANCATGNINTGGGQRISLGLMSAAASAAAATVLNGDPVDWKPNTPLACLPNTVLHVGWKMILGAATGVLRVVATPDGYFM